ncbi:MAG: lactonase family protein [Balneolaceae bacterium]|nr:lactonase family protein [Balneolaceae bacterium]
MKFYALFISLMMVLPLLTACSDQAAEINEIIYAGTFEGRDSEGIYIFEFNRATGELIHIDTVTDRIGPNFQAIHPNGKFLYSVSDDPFNDEEPYGTLSAYYIDNSTGLLQLINEQSVNGRGTAHVSVDPLGNYVYVSNYSEGNLSMYMIDDDGTLSESVDIATHEGSSVNQQRQRAAHVHSAIPSADGQFLYVSDLGIDKIMIYRIDRENDTLEPAETPWFENEPGSGPRHFTIHQNSRFAYSAEELTSTVAVLMIDENTGALQQIQRITMLPDDFDVQNSAADIHISPDGRFLYATNRGHNSLVIYEIDEANGTLTLIGHESTRGGHPRNFMIDELGEFLLVANRDDDNITVFRRDADSGLLNFVNEQTGIPMIVCLTQHILQ